MKKLNCPVFNKRFMTLAINILIVISILGLIMLYNVNSTSLITQTAYLRWEGESKRNFAQCTIFLPSDERLSNDQLEVMRKQITRSLSQKGVLESKENMLWKDAFLSEGKVIVKSEQKEYLLQAFGIGGDYFFFHPEKLITGSYINENDIARNYVIIDEMAAWNLFGSTNVQGLELQIENTTYIIAGVIKDNSNDYENDKEQSDKNIKSDEKIFQGKVYMQHSMFKKHGGKDINVYEAILPEPIFGYGKNLLMDSLATPEKEVLVNSERYKVKSILKNINDTSYLVIDKKGIQYPEFENKARIVEYKLIQIVRVIMFLIIVLIINSLLWFKRAGMVWQHFFEQKS